MNAETKAQLMRQIRKTKQDFESLGRYSPGDLVAVIDAAGEGIRIRLAQVNMDEWEFPTQSLTLSLLTSESLGDPGQGVVSHQEVGRDGYGSGLVPAHDLDPALLDELLDSMAEYTPASVVIHPPEIDDTSVIPLVEAEIERLQGVNIYV